MQKVSFYVSVFSFLLFVFISFWIVGCDSQSLEATSVNQVLFKKGKISSAGNGIKLVFDLEGDQLFDSIIGRSAIYGNVERTNINVGHALLNLTTGEAVFVIGQGLGTICFSMHEIKLTSDEYDWFC